jgi:hypothetical protein
VDFKRNKFDRRSLECRSHGLIEAVVAVDRLMYLVAVEDERHCRMC